MSDVTIIAGIPMPSASAVFLSDQSETPYLGMAFADGQLSAEFALSIRIFAGLIRRIPDPGSADLRKHELNI
ncbi:MAG: hypothetical protein ACHQAY_08645 [Hyphomicrobiales bacterium]